MGDLLLELLGPLNSDKMIDRLPLEIWQIKLSFGVTKANFWGSYSHKTTHELLNIKIGFGWLTVRVIKSFQWLQNDKKIVISNLTSIFGFWNYRSKVLGVVFAKNYSWTSKYQKLVLGLLIVRVIKTFKWSKMIERLS